MFIVLLPAVMLTPSRQVYPGRTLSGQLEQFPLTLPYLPIASHSPARMFK